MKWPLKKATTKTRMINMTAMPQKIVKPLLLVLVFMGLVAYFDNAAIRNIEFQVSLLTTKFLATLSNFG